jgi:nucleoside diphosphate-linked moiety X motif protein 19
MYVTTDRAWSLFGSTRKKNIVCLLMAKVFPGGVVDAADRSPEWQTRLRSTDPLLPHKIASLREAFEESGVLICTPEIKMGKEERLEWRKKCHGNPHAFLEMFLDSHTESLPDVNRVFAHSRWITP